jgi:thiamine-monophosphate kinase
MLAISYISVSGEFDFIDWIHSQQGKSPLVSLGIGDDLAALKWPASELLLVGVDQVIDGVHFDSSGHSPHQIGQKAMNRNLSDCAAMGCLPAVAVVAAALPKVWPMENARDLYRGLCEAAEAFDCTIVGGDTATWDGKLVLSVTILGRSAGIQPITRAGAKPGDNIYVTGPLGGSILGRHMTFQPRVALGRALAADATAMIDLSDGLSRDLWQICRASRVGAIIESDQIPIHPDAEKLSKRDGVPAIEHALHDGEDYELLLTSRANIRHAIRIGKITAEPGIRLMENGAMRTLEPRGWQHKIESRS